jgi:asparagine synthase (glutamine-hydrolysing)
LIAQMPSGLKLHNGTGKFIFKRALERVLPPAVLTRKKKGFAVPVAQWFRGDLKEYGYEAIVRRQDDVLNPAFLTRCWNQHQRGQRDWSALLWSVLMFRAWQDTSRAA